MANQLTVELIDVVESKLRDEAARHGISVSDLASLILAAHVNEQIRFAQSTFAMPLLPKASPLIATEMVRFMAVAGALKCEECSQTIKVADFDKRVCAHCGADLHALAGDVPQL